MMVKVYESERVTVGSAAYQAERARAERIAQGIRADGGGAVCRWDDDYNDHSATGRFVVTGRA